MTQSITDLQIQVRIYTTTEFVIRGKITQASGNAAKDPIKPLITLLDPINDYDGYDPSGSCVKAISIKFMIGLQFVTDDVAIRYDPYMEYNLERYNIKTTEFFKLFRDYARKYQRANKMLIHERSAILSYYSLKYNYINDVIQYIQSTYPCYKNVFINQFHFNNIDIKEADIEEDHQPDDDDEYEHIEDTDYLDEDDES